MNSTLPTLFGSLAAVASLCSGPAAWAMATAPAIDNSHKNVPIVTQIESDMRSHIGARLKKGATAPRYFMTMFSFQDDGNSAPASHTFANYLKVMPDQSYEQTTISWLPSTYASNPNICVFDGPFAMLTTDANDCKATRGRVWGLEESIFFATREKRQLGKWGPYEIKPLLYNLAQKRVAFLRSGSMKYLADDRASREEGTAINCLHAVSDLDKDAIVLGGAFESGYNDWGIAGTEHVLDHYKDKAAQWMIDPIDPTGDRHDWYVYSPSMN